MVLFTFSACTQDEPETIEVDGFKYTIIQDKDGSSEYYAKLIKYVGDADHVTVPAEVYSEKLDQNLKVTSIGGLAFYNLPVKNVILSEGTKRVENFSFGYSQIMRVEIPSTIEYIGDWSFVNCKALREVSIKAEKSPKLGVYAFKYYDDDSRDYEINPKLRIEVPSLSAYKTTDVFNNWREYQDNLVEVHND
ncbi:MAG: leucine-rich repeat protein [Bacillota bacterium]|jgi:hypothetical protein|nr:leucine-rich repeat protein [Bacillota bacterium]